MILNRIGNQWSLRVREGDAPMEWLYKREKGQRETGMDNATVVKFSRNGVPLPVTCVWRSTIWIAGPPPKVVAPPGDAVPSWWSTLYYWSVDFREYYYNIATRGQTLRHKGQFYFGWGCVPNPAVGAYNAPPDPLAGFKGPASNNQSTNQSFLLNVTKRRKGREKIGRGKWKEN